MKPMLASPAGELIRLPALLSPKLDGIRCLIIDGVACGRSLKPLPNKHVQRLFGLGSYNGLDGELIVGSPTAKDVFQQTSSGVMSIEGEPDVYFHVFDDFLSNYPFARRLFAVQHQVNKSGGLKKRLVNVVHNEILDAAQLSQFEEDYLAMGYEGVMLRAPDGPYKHGRSTAKEGWLLKVKRFEDAEAQVLGVTELMHNGNEAKRNELGQLERSSHKANKMGKKMLGALQVRDVKTGVEFDIGTGFTSDQRQVLWAARANLVGKLVKYKSQPTGVKEKPRFPVFLGFRDPRDL
jgi:DNA ligase-1